MPRGETARQARRRGSTPYHLAVDVRAVSEPRDFLRRAEGVLMRDEARHNLILGVGGALVDRPELYPVHELWLVEAAGAVVGAALRTPPHNLVVADPLADGAVDALAAHLSSAGVALNGVVANRPHADEFAECWTATTGASATLRVAQGVYALRTVSEVPVAAGGSRPATQADDELLVRWLREFSHEALPPEAARDESLMRRMLQVRLSGGEDEGLWFWEAGGEPVSLAGFGGPTPNGTRIGPVYTPPDRRGHGYATSLVAEISKRQLARGRRFCFLYTDLANPTSNAIYERMGYERVCESAEIGFGPRSP
jgi:predicted GNAT family acetyltransferase